MHSSTVLKGSFISLVAIIAFSAFATTASADSLDIPSACTGATPFLTVTQQITEADTGHHGTWATDTFTETALIYQATDGVNAFCAVGTINPGGTFVTTGPNSPENGDSLAAGITGTITGGETWVFPAGFATTTSDSTYEATPVNAPTEDSKFSDWQNEVFGSTTDANTFTFTYVIDADPLISWTNAGDGNDGDITNPEMSTVYVDETNGDDSNIGTETAPYETLQAAVDAVADGGTVNLVTDVTLSASVIVDKALTINGNGHMLLAPFAGSAPPQNAALSIINATGDVTVENLIIDGSGSSNIHDINIFDSGNVNLDGLTVKNASKAGITVNGAQVTVNNITTSDNAWGGINIDLSDSVINHLLTSLTVTGTSVHDESVFDIWRDDNTKNVTFNDAASQYVSTTYTHDTDVEGTIWGIKAATVATEAELRAALADTLIQTITFSTDITLAAELDITRAVTINGAGYSLNASFNNASVLQIEADDVTIQNLIEDGSGTTGNRGINIYVATGVLLDNVTAKNNAKNGIVVNGSTVTVNNVVTSGNGWEAIDVDMGGGVTTLAKLTVNGTSVHGETKAAIRIDDTSKTPTPTVIDTNDQYMASTTATLTDYFLKTKNVKTDTATTETTTSGTVNITVDIPADTIVVGDSSWDGIINPPTATTTTLSISGFDTTVISAITIGSDTSDLFFDKGVRLQFTTQADKKIGWFNAAGDFAEITDICSADTQTVGDALSSTGSCKMNVGSDLVVWTKHFSTFVTYTSAAISTGGGSSGGGGGGGNGPVVGGGGGGGSVAVALPFNGGAAPSANNNTNTNTGSTGQVLGAATYNFTVDLTVGSRGDDVTALQQILIAQGFDIPALTSGRASYGYFGVQTRTAVAAYQSAHGIKPTAGYFGPITRALMNAGTTPTMSDEQRTLLIAQLEAQLQSLLAQIKVLIGAQQ